MKIVLKIIICIAVVFLYACEYETLPTYSGVDNVYFSYAAVGGGGSVVDSTSIMFGYDMIPRADSLITIGVRILGSVTDYPRPVDFVLEQRSTAQLGIDVELLHDRSVVPAGSINGRIVIKLINNESLENGASLTAAIRLIENEHFKVDYTFSERFRANSNFWNYNATRYRVWYNNNNERPNMWTPGAFESSFTHAFGSYSREKFRLMCEVLPGCSWEYFTYGPNETPLSVFDRNFPTALLTGWSRAFHAYLENYKEVHGEPLRDENGEEIRSGTAFNT